MIKSSIKAWRDRLHSSSVVVTDGSDIFSRADGVWSEELLFEATDLMEDFGGVDDSEAITLWNEAKASAITNHVLPVQQTNILSSTGQVETMDNFKKRFGISKQELLENIKRMDEELGVSTSMEKAPAPSPTQKMKATFIPRRGDPISQHPTPSTPESSSTEENKSLERWIGMTTQEIYSDLIAREDPNLEKFSWRRYRDRAQCIQAAIMEKQKKSE